MTKTPIRHHYNFLLTCLDICSILPPYNKELMAFCPFYEREEIMYLSLSILPPLLFFSFFFSLFSATIITCAHTFIVA